MTSIVHTAIRHISRTDRVLIGGITLRLIVFVVAFATWVVMLRGRWNISEQIFTSVVVLVGFMAFTSAVNQIVLAAQARDQRRGERGRATADSFGVDNPELLASLLVAHAPDTTESLTLGGATRILVQQVGPLPLSRVLQTMELLTRHQWCTPDFDEVTEQRCWRLAPANRADHPSAA